MNDELIDPKNVVSNEIQPVESEAEMTDEDVLKLAKPSCRHCQGRGISGYNIVAGNRKEILCSCIVNRVERMERMVEKSEKLLNENNLKANPV